MPTTQQLMEDRANVWSEMTSILDTAEQAGRDLTAEERQTYDRAEARLDELTGDIARNEKHTQRAKEFGAPASLPDPAASHRDEPAKGYDSVFELYVRHGTGDLEPEQRKVLRAGFSEVDPAELRAAGVATGAAGGYFVPPAFRARVVEALKAYGNVRAVAEVITTDTGADLPWPTVDDTGNIGAILAENTQVTEQDITFGQTIIKAYTYTSKLVRVSLQLLQDQAFDLNAWLPRKLGERIGRIQNQHFTTGTGVSQPEGVQTNAVVGKTGAAGQVATITYDDLVDLIYSVDAAYRASGRCRFMLNDLSVAKLRKLRDDSGGAGVGRPIWEPSIQVGQPDSLLGYAIESNNDMPVMAANAKSVLFGDFFAGYLVRDVLGFQLLRLEERYADFLQVGFLGFQRGDGKPQDAGAVRAYRNAAA